MRKMKSWKYACAAKYVHAHVYTAHTHNGHTQHTQTYTYTHTHKHTNTTDRYRGTPSSPDLWSSICMFTQCRGLSMVSPFLSSLSFLTPRNDFLFVSLDLVPLYMHTHSRAAFRGSMDVHVWEHGNMEMWEHEGTGAWEHGDVGT